MQAVPRNSPTLYMSRRLNGAVLVVRITAERRNAPSATTSAPPRATHETARRYRIGVMTHKKSIAPKYVMTLTKMFPSA